MKNTLLILVGIIMIAFSTSVSAKGVGDLLSEQLKGSSFVNSFNEELLERKYPYSYLQLGRFISCSKGNVAITPLNDTFEEFAVIASKLDEKCFGEVNKRIAIYLSEQVENREKEKSLQPSLFDFNLLFEWKDSEQTKFSYEISNVLSPFQLSCGEECRYATEQLIKVGKDYYFLSYGSDHGINAKMITNEVVLFEVNMSTHKRIVVFNRVSREIGQFPNGDLEFFDKSVIVRGQKSYFKNVGGAFWYNTRRNFKGEILEFLDVDSGTCIPRGEFYKELENKLIVANKTQLCVSL